MSAPATTLRQAQRDASERLAALPHASPELEAALLLGHLLGKPRSYLFAWPDATLSNTQQAAYRHLVERRLAGEPIAYITGEREFWSLPLEVTSDTLIPRPETELLVELALERLQSLPSPRIADLGTGSGAIALALAKERPEALIHATDRREATLQVARRNAERLGLRRVCFFLGHWCQALPTDQEYDLIVSNPPYIEADDPHLSQGDLPREPAGALIAGPDGLEAIRRIARQCLAHLAPGGRLLLEHGHRQAAAVRRILHQHGYHEIVSFKDLAGRPRASTGSRPP